MEKVLVNPAMDDITREEMNSALNVQEKIISDLKVKIEVIKKYNGN